MSHIKKVANFPLGTMEVSFLQNMHLLAPYWSRVLHTEQIYKKKRQVKNFPPPPPLLSLNPPPTPHFHTVMPRQILVTKKEKYNLRSVENQNHNQEKVNFSRKNEESPSQESQKYT